MGVRYGGGALLRALGNRSRDSSRDAPEGRRLETVRNRGLGPLEGGRLEAVVDWHLHAQCTHVSHVLPGHLQHIAQCTR